MSAQSPRSFVVAALAGVALAAAVSSGVTVQTQQLPEKYNAIAVSTGSGPRLANLNVAGRVLITVNRWSSAMEREKLLGVFNKQGPDKLLDALMDNPTVGSLRLPNTLAWDLRYAFESPLPEGGRRVVLATDRPIGFEEAARQTKSTDYPFTLIEIRFDKSGMGVGKMSTFTKISLSRDKQTMELESYGSEPVQLTEVTIEK